MAQSAPADKILDLARALYLRGAIPEALAIAREVFVSLLDRDDLTKLSEWFQSLPPDPADPGAPSEQTVTNAIDWIVPVLDIPGSIRAVTNICGIRPSTTAVYVARVLREGRSGQRPRRSRRRFPIDVHTQGLGWEITSPILNAARRHDIVIPDDFTNQIATWLPMRARGRLSPGDVVIVNSYARQIRDLGETEPALRLVLTSAVTSLESVPMGQVIDIVRPDVQVRTAAELFASRGYPTEAMSVLVDALEGRPDIHDVQQILWAEGKRWFGSKSRSAPPQAAPPSEPDVLRHLPLGGGVPTPSRPTGGRPPLPPDKTPGPAPEKSFFFLLRGEQAYQSQVVRGQPVDLYFLYDVPSIEALAKLEGKSLSAISAAAKKGRQIDIGVFIKPIGLTFRDNDTDYQVATIKNDELTNPPCFELQAPAGPVQNSGVIAVLEYNGAEVFQAFIHIAIVDAIDKASSTITQLAISRTTFDLSESLPRDLTAFIMTNAANRGECRVSMRIGSALPGKPQTIDRDDVKVAIDRARVELAKVAESKVFQELALGRWGPAPGQEEDFLGALCRLMSAGSRLHKFLKDSPATKGLAAAIETLEPGSKISIFTDSVFIPWEIVFPRYFLSTEDRVSPDAPPKNYEPDLLWGNRFEFETVLVFADPEQDVQNTLPSARRQPGKLNMRIGVGSTVEKPAGPGAPATPASLNATERHRAYCNQNSKVAHWLNGTNDIKLAFESPDYEVSLLYLMCHGESDGTDEKLDFGSYQPNPHWLAPDTYSGWPVVFINSCEIGNISPHVFDSFLRRFREKHAFGLIASSFPLPTRFATLYGCDFLEAYRNGTRVGEILFDLRKRLLKETNPLAFFYALQCPLDIQRPSQPEEI